MDAIFCLAWLLVGMGILIKEVNVKVFGAGVLSAIGSVLTMLVILLAAFTGDVTSSAGCIGLMLCGVLCSFALLMYLIFNRGEDVFRQAIIVCSAYIVPLFAAVCMLELINLPARGRSSDWAGFGVLVGLMWSGLGIWHLHLARQERRELEKRCAEIVAEYELPDDEQALTDAFNHMRSHQDHTAYSHDLGVEAWRKWHVQVLANEEEEKAIQKRVRMTKKARKRLKDKLLPKL